MKKITYLPGLACAMLLALILFATSAIAQSTDPDAPTQLTSNTISGSTNDEEVVYYYGFTAGPGVVKITADIVSANIYGKTIRWSVTDVNFKSIQDDYLSGDQTGARKVTEVTLAKQQKVVFKLTVGSESKSYKIRFDGAIKLSGNGGIGGGTGNGMGSGSGGGSAISDITGDNSGGAPQQICLPRNGVLILTMQDGKKARVDLAKVQKIEIQ